MEPSVLIHSLRVHMLVGRFSWIKCTYERNQDSLVQPWYIDTLIAQKKEYVMMNFLVVKSKNLYFPAGTRLLSLTGNNAQRCKAS